MGSVEDRGGAVRRVVVRSRATSVDGRMLVGGGWVGDWVRGPNRVGGGGVFGRGEGSEWGDSGARERCSRRQEGAVGGRVGRG